MSVINITTVITMIIARPASSRVPSARGLKRRERNWIMTSGIGVVIDVADVDERVEDDDRRVRTDAYAEVDADSRDAPKPRGRRDRCGELIVVGVEIREDRLRRLEIAAVETAHGGDRGVRVVPRSAARVSLGRVLVEDVHVRAGLERDVRVQSYGAVRVTEVRVERHVVGIGRRERRRRARGRDRGTQILGDAVGDRLALALGRETVGRPHRLVLHDDDHAERGRDHDRQERGRDHHLHDRVTASVTLTGYEEATHPDQLTTTVIGALYAVVDAPEEFTAYTAS